MHRTCLISTIDGMANDICPLGPCIPKMPHIITQQRPFHTGLCAVADMLSQKSADVRYSGIRRKQEVSEISWP